MRRQLYKTGGVTRQNYGLGSWVKKKIRKLIPNELADVASKAAPFVAPFNPGIAGLMRGIGRFDQRGSLSDALKQGLATTAFGAGTRALGGAENIMGGGLKGGLTNPIGEGRMQSMKNFFDTKNVNKTSNTLDKSKEGLEIVKKGTDFLSDKLPGFEGLNQVVKEKLLVGGISAAGSYIYEKFLADEPPQQDNETLEEYKARRKENVGRKMRTYMDNYLAYDKDYSSMTDEQKEAFVARYNMYQGGRVGYQTGGISMSNTLAQNIAANRAQANQVQQMLQAARSKLPGAAPAGITSVATEQAMPLTMRADIGDLTRSFDPAGRSDARNSLIGGPPSGVQTISPNRKPINYSTIEQTPGAPPRMPGMGGMNQEDFMKLSEAEQMKMMDADVAERNAELEKYGNFADGRTIDPRAGGISAYMDLVAVFKNDYPNVQLTGNETLAELDQMMLDIQDQQGYNQGGRVGLAFGTPEEGIKSLDAGATNIIYEGNEGPKSPQEEQQMAGMGYAGGSRPSFEQWVKMQGADINALSGNEYVVMLRNYEREYPSKAQGGRIGQMYGTGPNGLPGIPRMASDGMEFDMRQNGGFQGLGAKEGKDDVPAMLAKNEFVMTADAVRGAGDGDIEKGAQRMYDTMQKLERRMA